MPSLLDQVESQLAPKHVSIIEFAESSDYCNKPLYPRQAVLLKLLFLEELTGEEEDVLTYWIKGGRNGTEILISPNPRERVEWLRSNGYPHFKEAVLAGGRRSGKGYCLGIAMAYKLYNCLQLQDPGGYYGIDKEKEIFFSCIAGSEEQAKEFQFGDLQSTVETCRALDPYIVKSLETEIRVATSVDLQRATNERARGNRIQKDIARLRGKALAANAGTLRGSATLVATIDEMAHMIPGESKAAADKVYEAMDPSMDQFGNDSMLFCSSSPYSKVGKFFDRFVAGQVSFDPKRSVDEHFASAGDSDISDEGQNGNPRLLMFEFPSWAMFEGYQKSRHQKRLKWVLTASPDWDVNEVNEKGEEIWNEKDKLAIKEARAKEAENPESYKVERRGKFAEVSEAYLSAAKVDLMFAGMPTEYVYTYDRETGEQSAVPTAILTPFSSNRGGGIAGKHKFHIDPSSTTAGFGYAIAHTEIIENWKGEPEEHVVFDKIKRWQPKHFQGGVIRWGPILKEMVVDAEIFMPFEISFGQHEATQAMQELSEKLQFKNFPTRVYPITETAEANWHRYEVCKTSIYSGLVHAPKDTEDCEWAALELKFLQEKTGGKYPRIDRQEQGPVQTKDIADAIAECVHTLIGNQMMNRTRKRLAETAMVGGAPGGYAIGLGSNPPASSPLPPEMAQMYASRAEKAEREQPNPARGVIGRGSKGFRRGNRARW